MTVIIRAKLVVAISLMLGFGATNLYADGMTVWDNVKSNSETTLFAQYMRDLGLVEALNTENLIIPWTLFVPSDDAFTKLPDEIKHKLDNDQEFMRQILMSHLVLGASVSVDGIGTGDILTTASGFAIDLIQRDDLYVKDVVVTTKDLLSSNGVVHLVDCVMYVQPTKDDDRLSSELESDFEQTACCLADSQSDLHHSALLR